MKEPDPSLAFLRDLIHELNDPFAAIHGGLQLLPLAGGLPEAQRSHLTDSLLRNSRVLKRALEDASSYIRLTAGGEQPTPSACDLSVVLREALEDARPGLETRGQTVTGLSDQPSPLVATVALVRSCLGCLLLSLSRGAGHGSALTCDLSRDDEHYKLELLCQGSVKAGDYRATLARLMADALRGSLSQIHSGASSGWLLQLPLSPPEATAGQVPALALARGSGAMALVVEDNALARKALMGMLRGLGVASMGAENAEAALSVLRDTTPDIVFCDLGLPGELDGRGLAACLRGRDTTSAIPLVAVTGDGAAERCTDFNQVLGKPLDIERLALLLREYGLADPDK